jgi:hypothetical protein
MVKRNGVATNRPAVPRRRSGLPAVAAVVGVVAVLAALVVVKVTTGGSSTVQAASSSVPAPAAVVASVTGVPGATFDDVGTGTVRVLPTARQGTALTAGGRPRVLYIGAEYCPYCAAERWSVVAALARFGTWSGLGETASSSTDVYPGTATLSFHDASYSSPLLSFTGVEAQSNVAQGGSYATLDTPSRADAALLEDVGGGSYPFVDLGGRRVVSGSSYDPAVLEGLTARQIAADLEDPASPVARAVDGTANVLTASVCGLTGGVPAAVCGSAGVTTATSALAAQSG